MELSCPLGIRALSRKYNLSCFGVLSHIINPLLTKREVKMAGYWLSSFFACLWPRAVLKTSGTVFANTDLPAGK